MHGSGRKVMRRVREKDPVFEEDDRYMLIHIAGKKITRLDFLS